jgi:hypothetical protein
VKNEDDILEHELTDTHSLMDIIKENETSVCIPKIKEKLNLLKEALEDIADHYTLSQDINQRSILILVTRPI